MASNPARQFKHLSTQCKIGYATVALFLVLWLLYTITTAIAYGTEMWWFSYFSVDYRLGFVRRGLAGEMLDLFPADHYFTGAWTLRCLVSALFVIGLTGVAWTVAVNGGRSERRLMLALLTPVLPFGFATAINGPHTDLLAATALAMFAVIIASAKAPRRIVVASASYGAVTAFLAFIHEAGPLLYSLGAVLAIVVLSAHSPIRVQRLSALLAVAPGLIVVLAVALIGRRGISSQLCALVPHKALNWPAAGNLSTDQVMRGQRFYVDYHDWVCRNIIDKLDQTPIDAAKYVASFGAVALIGSIALGIAIFAATIFSISSISGVPFGRFGRVLHSQILLVTLSAMLLLPIFATTTDWTRWWVKISFDVGIVYLLYASGQREASEPPTRLTRVLFAVGIVLFAAVPLGGIPNVGMPAPV